MSVRIFLVVLWGAMVSVGLAVGCGNPVTPGQEASTTENPIATEKIATEDPAQEPIVSVEPTTPDVTESSPEPAPEAGPDDTLQERATPEPEVQPEPEPKPLSYHKDIRAIAEEKCLSCHQQNGIGPFSLDTYTSLSSRKSLVRDAVEKRRMPPWGADNQCNQYNHNFDLTESQRTAIIQWIDEGVVEGDPKDYQAPKPPDKVGLPRVDLQLKMPQPYTPDRKPDDYRCFVLDWTPTTTKFITGFQVKPGNPKMVHHIIAYLASPSEAASYVKRDQQAAGQGYRCFGVAGGPAGIRWIGVWAPGVPGGPYAAGTGIKVLPGSKIIFQIHYNVLTSTPGSDQSTIELQLEDKVEKEALFLPWANPLWFGNKQMKIPAGQANVQHEFSFDLFAAFPLFVGYAKQRGMDTTEVEKILNNIKSITIHTAMLHMHLRGQSGKLYIERSRNQTCMLNIPRWDFNWQLSYDLKQPIVIKPGDSVGISCKFDNTADKQPVVDGIKQKPVDVYWGEGTNDEMCLGVLYITCQNGEDKATPCPDLGSLLSQFL